MFVRRRPLLRAAITGGAYVAGKKSAERSAAQAGQAPGQDERSGAPERAPRAGQRRAAAPAPQAPGPPLTDQLEQLASLHERGALSDEEFAAAKARLLGALGSGG